MLPWLLKTVIIGGMKSKSQIGGTIAIAVAAIALVLGAYFGAYFGLTDRTDDVHSTGSTRFVRWKWMEFIFKPAAFVETKLTDREVDTWYLPPL